MTITVLTPESIYQTTMCKTVNFTKNKSASCKNSNLFQFQCLYLYTYNLVDIHTTYILIILQSTDYMQLASTVPPETNITFCQGRYAFLVAKKDLLGS